MSRMAILISTPRKAMHLNSVEPVQEVRLGQPVGLSPLLPITRLRASFCFVDTNDVYITTHGEHWQESLDRHEPGLECHAADEDLPQQQLQPVLPPGRESTGLSQNLNNDGVNWNVNLSALVQQALGRDGFRQFQRTALQRSGKSTSFWYYNPARVGNSRMKRRYRHRPWIISPVAYVTSATTTAGRLQLRQRHQGALPRRPDQSRLPLR